MLFKDNAIYIAQTKGVYIKKYIIIHISPTFSYTYELLKNGKINIHHIHSSNNLALFNKLYVYYYFRKTCT